LGEIREILANFKVDKSSGLDGWTVEFLIHFFDLVGGDLLDMVEESRLKGHISDSLNLTFITSIPKVNKPLTFRDYRPISLCNLCYKIISKIIANQIKPILSRSLSEEQLGFLQGRQIQDAIGTVHECLHNIKNKKLKSLVLKLDLQKAYDYINWDLLRMILLQIGLGLRVTN
jgi:mannosylglycoprotein endo-beta-mannosidase